ncbi:MAG: ABC transporter substrate-binding protein [Solirubrobacteraceae bacterium MAG38_C4-C5]|nr:ABC transporter substrate-binding protein [Candidatus Siliceabacter maunaloa]
MIARCSAAVVAVVALAGCGAQGDPEPTTPGTDEPITELTIYSSLPSQGPDREEAIRVRQGIDLALEQAGGNAGDIAITHEPLDNATREDEGWSAARVSANAREAAQEDDAGVYIGELRSAASVLSMPILNEAGVAQISPAASAVGLTREGPGAQEGEPGRYYPTGEGHFARLIPDDGVQGAVLAGLMVEERCMRAALVNDGELEPAQLVPVVAQALRDQGAEVVLDDVLGEDGLPPDRVAERAGEADADCLLYAGGATPQAARVLLQAAEQLGESTALFAAKGLAEPSFLAPRSGLLPTELAQRLTLTVPPGGEPASPVRAALLDELGPGAQDDPASRYVLYGYEAMQLALDAIARSGTGRREDVVDALLDTQDRRSVLGTYSIEDGGGSSLSEYAVFGVDDMGALVPRRVVAVG